MKYVCLVSFSFGWRIKNKQRWRGRWHFNNSHTIPSDVPLSIIYIQGVSYSELTKLIWIWRIEICTFKLYKLYLYIDEMRTFDLWPLDLVKNNIPVLHSLRPEWWQNFSWNSIILFRNIFFQKIKIRWLQPLAYWFEGLKWFWKPQSPQ